MIKIYSQVQEGLLLHIIFKLEDFKEGRQDLIEPENFLQCASLNFNKGKTFRPHRHKIKEIKEKTSIAQESWVIIRGGVVVYCYDIDDKLLEEHFLSKGDIFLTLYGGHNYAVEFNDTLIYEFKSGPYYGQSEDKVFI